MFEGPELTLSTPAFDAYLRDLGFTIGERWRRPKLAAWRLRFARWILRKLQITAVPTPEQLARLRELEKAVRE